jgi:hypothetical protein
MPGSEKAVTWEMADDGLSVTLPEKPRVPHGCAIEVTLGE